MAQPFIISVPTLPLIANHIFVWTAIELAINGLSKIMLRRQRNLHSCCQAFHRQVHPGDIAQKRSCFLPVN